MWKIPKDPEAGEYLRIGAAAAPPKSVGSSYQPAASAPAGGPGRVVNGAFMVLKGHRSIVNQVRFNPHTYMICSSGVEKVIKVGQSFLRAKT